MQRYGTPVRMVEVLMPAVDTPWHEGNPPRIAIPVSTAVEGMLPSMARCQDEIRVAGTKPFYALSRLAPGLATAIFPTDSGYTLRYPCADSASIVTCQNRDQKRL